MDKGRTAKAAQKPNLSSAHCSGKFTKEECDILNKAIDKYISENYECSRDVALNRLITKRGNSPSLLTVIGKRVLPNRPPRSVYNFFRRHLLTHKTGKWSDSELLLLLKTFFQEDFESNRWKSAAKVLDRSPEQIHDKFREMKPYIENYKQLVTNPNLSDEEKVAKLKSVPRVPRPGSKGQLADYAGMSAAQQQRLYDCIRELMRKSRRKDSIQNIPWTLVQEKFPNYSATKLRIHFNMSLLPKVYRETYPGFSANMVARLSIRWIRKLLKRPNFQGIQSLNDINFGSKFPQLPVIYVKHCTRRALIKIVRRYQRHLHGPQRFIFDLEHPDVDLDELDNLSNKSFNTIFSSKNLKHIIKFAYKNMDVKLWKKEDKTILKRIRKEVLPECKL